MSTIKANFDGRVFVPADAVELPVGTQVDVLLPSSPTTATAGSSPPPATPSATEQAAWAEIRKELAATPPAFPTVEEAMRHSRKRP
jgi:hypothetical protein